MTDLELKRNPMHNRVFLANCVSDQWAPRFPQGGSGWLLSRAAAGHLWKIRDQWRQSLNSPDDTSFGRPLEKMSIRVVDTHGRAFPGQMPPKEFWVDRFEKRSDIAECRKMDDGTRGLCQQHSARLNRVVFLHSFLDGTVSYGEFVLHLSKLVVKI
jgi:hypothetical protein